MLVLFVRFQPGAEDARRELLAAHHAYLNQNFALGVFVASGPTPTGDGVILATGDPASVANITSVDPFIRAGIARYDSVHLRVTRSSGKPIEIEGPR